MKSFVASLAALADACKFCGGRMVLEGKSMSNARWGAVSRILAIAMIVTGTSAYAFARDANTAAERLKEIHRTVMDSNQTFSISQTLAELETLESKIPSGAVEARGELNYIRGFILYRAGRAAESIAASKEALRIDADNPFLSKSERSRFIYNLAEQAERIGEWDTAIDAYRKAIPLFDADPAYNDNQRLVTSERLAFCLHEAGNYAEAFVLNKEVLEKGERLLGPDSEELFVVVTNLAQNAYMLNQPEAAKNYLERLLNSATKHNNLRYMDTSLFQLGVLAFEQGRVEEAETLMKQRVALARKSGDAGRIEEAEEALDVLHEKLKR